jgi:hypothetical protein
MDWSTGLVEFANDSVAGIYFVARRSGRIRAALDFSSKNRYWQYSSAEETPWQVVSQTTSSPCENAPAGLADFFLTEFFQKTPRQPPNISS